MMRKRILKITLAAALSVLLIAVLCGCNLINRLFHPEGPFGLSETEITLKIGDTYEVTPSDGHDDSFTLESSDVTKVELFGKTGIKAVGKTDSPVTITATNDDGETAELKVNVDYADVTSVKISVDNQYQLLKEGETPKTAKFSFSLNDGTSPEKIAKWKVLTEDDAVVGTAEGKTYAYLPEKGKRYFVTATVDGEIAHTSFCAFEDILVYLDDYGVGTEENLSLHVYYFDALSIKTAKAYVYDESGDEVYSCTLSATKPDADGKRTVYSKINPPLSEGKYTLKVVAGSDEQTLSFSVKNRIAANHIEISASGKLNQTKAETVVFTANVAPEKADTEKVKWYVNDNIVANGKTFSFTPTKHGEFRITAEINKIKNTETVLYLDANDVVWRDGYAEHFHDYGGYPQNRYISSKEELKNLILFVLENKIRPISFYVGYSTVDSVKEDVSEVREYIEESGIIPGYTLTTSGNEITVDFRYYADDTNLYPTINSPDRDAPEQYVAAKQSPYSAPHYVSEKKERNFYIDSVSRTMSVSTSNMLYKAVSWGYKPVFTGAKAAELKQIYDNARDALSCIISDETSEYEKVHAIYDYIVYNVRYDHDCANAAETSASVNLSLNDKMRYYGYYLEGIFLDKFYEKDMHAVCDGKSKAFVLMCGIEGIDAVRVSGEASSDGKEFGGHAWNKVLLDIGGTGDKEWYFVDTTWGDLGDGKNTEVLSHAYFLLSDKQTESTHREKQNHGYPKANGEFDYYAYDTYIYNGTEYNYVVTGSDNAAIQQMATAIKALPKTGESVVEFEFANNKTANAIRSYTSDAMKEAKRYGWKYVYYVIRENVLVMMISSPV